MITGGSRGQGADEVRLFAEQGAQVVIADVREAEGKALALELGGNVCFVKLDVTQEVEWTRAVAVARSAFGGLDILVNNAGLFAISPLAECTLDNYMRIIRVNQVGAFLGMRAVAKVMETGGSIVNISSVLGIVANSGTMAYTASKFAIRGMTKVAALELAPRKIRVNSIHPGLIETDMVRDLMSDDQLQELVDALPLKRIGTGSDVARIALFLASDDSAFCTGSEFVCDGGEIASASSAT